MEGSRHSYEEPLLEEKGLSFHLQSKNLRSPSWGVFVGLQAVITVLYTLIALTILGSRSSGTESADLVYSPAREAVVPEARMLHAKLGANNEFTGEVGPESDAAWSSLFEYANIRVTPDELRKSSRESVLLSDGSGDSLGVLDVFHQLHCVKYIHEYVHQEYYNLKPTDVPFIVHVADNINSYHCIDMIRQIIMCKADTSLMTFKWLPDTQMPFPSFEMEHECRNWDSIVEWSKERAIDINDFSLVVHPTLGPAFKEPEWNHTKKHGK